MQLTIHLFTETELDPAALLRGIDEVDVERSYPQPRLELDFECVAVNAFREHRRPAWAGYIDEYFDVDWKRSVTTSMVLLVRAAERWFAVTFGQGRHLLRNELLVSDFGIRVTANAVDAEALRSISSTSLDGTSRRTAQTVAVPSPTRAFTVDLVGEWVRSLGGWTDNELTRGMTGSQSLVVDTGPGRTELKQLHELLVHLRDRYEAADYRDHFPFLDTIVPLPLHDAAIADLDAELVRRMIDPGGAVGLVAPDAQPGDGERYSYRLRRPGGQPYHHFDILAVRTAAMRYRDPLALRVDVIDQQGGAPGSRPLRDHLAAEIDLAERGYFVLAEGRWFRIDPSSVARLELDLHGIPEFDSDRLDLPHWWHEHDEDVYNAATASHRDWVNLDQNFFYGPDRRYDKIEICDLLTPRMDLVCVKRLRNASSMSHLFSQGSVSARLYRTDPSYRAVVEEAFRNRWHEQTMPTPTVVYAVGTERRGPIRSTLPFFSRLNLCNHARTVREHGMEVALARIAVTKVSPTRTLSDMVPEQLQTDASGQGLLFDM